MTADLDAEAGDVPVAEPQVRAPWWRRLLGAPLFWAGALALAAAPWYLAGRGTDVLPFLLTLVSGFFLGVAFVSATTRIASPVTATVVHVGGGVAAVPLLYLSGEVPAAFLDLAPEAVRALLFEARMALVPAAGWVWVTLLARVTSLLRQREASRRPPGPDWEGDGEGAVVRFTAAPFGARAYSTTVGVVIGATATIVVAFLVATGGAALQHGPRLALLFLGLVFVLPVFLTFGAVLRWRTVPCAVRFVRDRLRIEVDGAVHDVAVRDLELLRWRSGSTLARIEARAPGLDLSLVVGMARPPEGRSADLPPLSRRMRRVLEAAGLVEERSRDRAVLTFRRPATATAPADKAQK